MGRKKAKWNFLEKTERKLKSPPGAPRITEQPRRHGSSARYIRDPMAQGYRPGGACSSWGTMPRKSSRSPGLFLVVSHYTIWTHGHNPSNISCDPWPPGQLGAGKVHYRRVCIYVAHGKQRRSSSTTSWCLSSGNIFSIVLWRSKPGLRFLYSYSSRNSSRCSPLLSLTSTQRPRFCAEDLPKPRWSTFEEDNLLHATKPKKVDQMRVVTFLWHLWWDSRAYTRAPKSRPPNLGT